MRGTVVLFLEVRGAPYMRTPNLRTWFPHLTVGRRGAKGKPFLPACARPPLGSQGAGSRVPKPLKWRSRGEEQVPGGRLGREQSPTGQSRGSALFLLLWPWEVALGGQLSLFKVNVLLRAFCRDSARWNPGGSE